MSWYYGTLYYYSHCIWSVCPYTPLIWDILWSVPDHGWRVTLRNAYHTCLPPLEPSQHPMRRSETRLLRRVSAISPDALIAICPSWYTFAYANVYGTGSFVVGKICHDVRIKPDMVELSNPADSVRSISPVRSRMMWSWIYRPIPIPITIPIPIYTFFSCLTLGVFPSEGTFLGPSNPDGVRN